MRPRTGLKAMENPLSSPGIESRFSDPPALKSLYRISSNIQFRKIYDCRNRSEVINIHGYEQFFFLSPCAKNARFPLFYSPLLVLSVAAFNFSRNVPRLWNVL